MKKVYKMPKKACVKSMFTYVNQSGLVICT